MRSGSPIANSRFQLALLIFLAVGLNINTIFLDYAFDDYVVLTENKFVEKGIRGIPEIISSDLIAGCSSTKNLLSQPRYRPVALVLFAIEHQFFGENPRISHLINILLFALMIALLFKLLNAHLFRVQNKFLAFLACLIYVVHPIHTEVIANVKSRDEIITFIFILFSLIELIKYHDGSKIVNLFLSLFCFLLALFTRESAITFIGVIPLVFYFFYDQKFWKSIQRSFPFIIVFCFYLLIRSKILGLENSIVYDVSNSPYLYATIPEAFATKVFILFKYILLQIVPHPLSSDYGFNQIPYIRINSFQFLFSFVLLAGLISYAIYTFRKRSLFSFCILYFLVTISVGSNFIIDLGTPLAERMLFQSSLAFSIFLAILILRLHRKSAVLSTGVLLLIITLYSMKTIARNSQWKNNETLFLTDIVTSPNSARLNLNAAEIYRFKAENENNKAVRNDLLQKAVFYCEKSLSINPVYPATYISLGFTYFDLYDFDKSAELFLEASRLDTASAEAKECRNVMSTIFYKQGRALFQNGNKDDAILKYLKSVELNPDNKDAWRNMAEIYLLKHDSINAMNALRESNESLQTQ